MLKLIQLKYIYLWIILIILTPYEAINSKRRQILQSKSQIRGAMTNIIHAQYNFDEIYIQIYQLQLQNWIGEGVVCMNGIVSYSNERNSFRRGSLYLQTDFNSQLITKDNKSDFHEVINRLILDSISIDKFQTISAQKPIKKILHSITQRNHFLSLPKLSQEKKRKKNKVQLLLRHPTTQSSIFSLIQPQSRHKLKTISIQIHQKFQRYESPPIKINNIQTQRKTTSQIIKERQQIDRTKLKQIQIMKPWQTKKDLFHQTLKYYVAQKNKGHKRNSITFSKRVS